MLFSSRKGFTLLEVMLAMMILALISLGVAAGLSAGIRAWESGEKKLDKFQHKRIVYERLFREISSAINLRGKKEDDERYKMIFNGESDSISFVTTAESYTFPGFPIGLKESSISVESGRGLIMREAMFSSDDYFDRDHGIEYVLDPDVSSIQFRYYYLPRPKSGEEMPDEGEWLDSWGPEHVEIEESSGSDDEGNFEKSKEVKMRLPLAVEVTLTVIDPDSEQVKDWTPLVIPLKEARLMGVSLKRRPRL